MFRLVYLQWRLNKYWLLADNPTQTVVRRRVGGLSTTFAFFISLNRKIFVSVIFIQVNQVRLKNDMFKPNLH